MNTCEAVEIIEGEAQENINDSGPEKPQVKTVEPYKVKAYVSFEDVDKVDEHLNEPLHVTNVLAQAIEVANQETGEINSSTRVVIHAEEGDFAAASPTLAHAFGNLFSIFGTPDKWAAPLVIKIVEKKSRRGYKFFDIELMAEKGRK